MTSEPVSAGDTRAAGVRRFFSQLYSNLVREKLATNLWFGKSSCPAPFKSGGRAVRQIYTGNIWEKSGFRGKTKRQRSDGLRLNHRLQTGPKPGEPCRTHNIDSIDMPLSGLTVLGGLLKPKQLISNIPLK